MEPSRPYNAAPMARDFASLTTSHDGSRALLLEPQRPICQGDLPLDTYDEAMRPYAESYLHLPDRTPETVLPWLDQFIEPALRTLGPQVLLLAHFYMGGEIVKLVERYGGSVADSYALALLARDHEADHIVESAVHFMAETAAILARDEQSVWITNPRAGCTMEMMADPADVQPTIDALQHRFGDDVVVLTYMNTSGALKALAGRTGGAVCTSSNAHHVMAGLLESHPDARMVFLPDEHLGRNTAHRLGMDLSRVVKLPAPRPGVPALADMSDSQLEQAKVLLWNGHCGVHTIFTVDMVNHWRAEGYEVHVHPESPLDVVNAADGSGSTHYLWNVVTAAKPGSKLAIATEGHFIANAARVGKSRDVDVVHLADVPGEAMAGCGCATMSRNDPPHLAGTLDLLARGCPPEAHRVLPGDRVDHATGQRVRLPDADRQRLKSEAATALHRMITMTESAS